MKVLTLMQPWATLVVIGAKKFETRSRNWTYRGDFLVHCSKEMNKEAKALANTDMVAKIFAVHGINQLSFGSIIGQSRITNSFKTDIADAFFLQNFSMYQSGSRKINEINQTWMDNVDREKELGDYSLGRWFYELLNPVSFPTEDHYKVNGSIIKGWEFDETLLTHSNIHHAKN